MRYKPLDDPDAITRALDESAAYCKDAGTPLTLERVCVSLGVARRTLLNKVDALDAMDEDEMDERTYNCMRALKRVYLACNATLVEHSLKPGVAPAAPIFWGKNNYGYTDRIEQDVTSRVVFTGEDNLKD